MEVAKDVFLDTINHSPKFRTKFIEEQIKQDTVLTKQICEVYDLHLVKDIYYFGIVKETFNSKKRRELKYQEIMFIKKIMIFQSFLRSIIEFIDETYELDQQFTDQFHNNFHSDVDRVLFENIISDLMETYFNGPEYLNR